MAETWSISELVNAGWAEADLKWEGLMQDAVQAFAAGDGERARSLAGEGLQVARDRFDTSDPRLGASLANYAVLLRATGTPETVGALLEEARSVWAACDPWIEQMTAPRVARSSLFHMRMEQKHRDTYEERWRTKWREMACDARGHVSGLGAAAVLSQDKAKAALERWRRECPAMLNDTRKLMAAVLLLLTG